MRNIAFFILLISTLACKEGKNTSEPSPELSQSYLKETLQINDSIKRIISSVNFRHHPYEISEKLKLIEAEVNQSKAINKLSPTLYVEYGQVLLQAGKTQEAINVLEEILELLPQNKKINSNTKTLHDFLAIAYMRLGEQTNCIENHSTESCLFPIKGKGVHINKSGSENAINIYKNILEVFPEDYQSKWLLNLAYMTLGEYPEGVPKNLLIDPSVFTPEYEGIDLFENISMNLGVDVNNLAGGAVTDDFNNDGYIDIIATSWDLKGDTHYFENDGAGNFKDKTVESGLEDVTGGLNVIQADYNNDGFLDLYIIRGAWSGYKMLGQLPNSLLKNNGNGTFTDVTISSNLYTESPTQAAVWFDFNVDGWLDLFVGNETHTPQEKNSSQLFLNNKNGTFTDIAPQLGLNITKYVKGVSTGDINNDGLPDLYISILDDENLLYLNNGLIKGQWQFEEIASAANVEEPIQSFPTWFFDFDNDGWDDLFVSSYDTEMFRDQGGQVARDYLNKPVQSDFPRMYKNNKDGTYSNVTKQVSLDHVLPTMGCNYGDIDNDGNLDFYLGTGAPDFRSIVPNRMFRNADGKIFQDITYAGNFGHIQKGHGVAFADLDNDGDQDIYTVMGGSVSGDIFQNALFENPGNRNKSITLRLKGTTSNRSAIGAKIKLTIVSINGTTRDIYNTVSSGGSFGSNSLQAEIGLGDATQIKNIAIKWPNGSKNYVSYGAIELKENLLLNITEGEITYEVLKLTPFYFNKMVHTSNHNH
ncbi:FG-GAP-like repeat-containing protein [Jejudonia soesokkakensis]|uniref:FG-GAP-like repeat-containing protein n=1 Tax=Jejudonia soesokkakensis TaxID=1323432 RepID=A0ABW2MXQ5_9FLAO